MNGLRRAPIDGTTMPRTTRAATARVPCRPSHDSTAASPPRIFTRGTVPRDLGAGTRPYAGWSPPGPARSRWPRGERLERAPAGRRPRPAAGARARRSASCTPRPVDGKRGRDDLVHGGAVPAPGRHATPVVLGDLARLRVHRVLVHARGSPALHQHLAVHDGGVHVAAGR